jgi:hypothetical protein
MSNWIKIDDDLRALPATPDPQEVVSISALESEIADLQSRIDSIHLIEIPEGASEELIALVMDANAKTYADTALIQDEVKAKQELLTELKKI